MGKEGRDPSYTYRRQFAKRLKACRIAAGYKSYSAFADSIGLEHETYRTYEAGRSEPPFHTLARISDTLEASLDFLIKGRNGERLAG